MATFDFSPNEVCETIERSEKLAEKIPTTDNDSRELRTTIETLRPLLESLSHIVFKAEGSSLDLDAVESATDEYRSINQVIDDCEALIAKSIEDGAIDAWCAGDENARRLLKKLRKSIRNLNIAVRQLKYELKNLGLLTHYEGADHPQPDDEFPNEDHEALQDGIERSATWLVNTASSILHPRDEETTDEKILTLSQRAGSDGTQENLVLWRCGPTILGIDRNTNYDDRPTNKQQSVWFNTHVDHCVPDYAVPTPRGQDPPLTIRFLTGNKATNRSYDLQSESDIHLFQQAVTEYRVVDDAKNVTFLMPEAKLKWFTEVHEGICRVQIWTWEPLAHIKKDSQPAPIQRRNTDVDPRSFRTMESAMTGTTYHTFKGQINPSILSESFDDDGSTLLLVDRQPPPALVIFTMIDGTEDYTMLHIDLKSPISIIPSNNPKHLLLQTSPGASPKPFLIHRLSVPPSSLSSWNISIFGRPLHHSLKTKRDKHGKKIVDELKVKYLRLAFKDVERKAVFESFLQSELEKRDQRRNDRNHAVVTAGHLQTRVARVNSGIQFVSRSSSVANSPPQLSMPRFA